MKKPTFNRRTAEFRFSKLCKRMTGRFHGFCGDKSCLDLPINCSHERRICQQHSGTKYHPNTMPPLLKCWISLYFLTIWHVVRGGIFPETLFLAVLLLLLALDSRKCSGEPCVNMKWNMNLEKNATTVEIANHQIFSSEMAFWMWRHLSENFVFYRTGEGRGKYRAKPLRSLLEHRKSYRCDYVTSGKTGKLICTIQIKRLFTWNSFFLYHKKLW